VAITVRLPRIPWRLARSSKILPRVANTALLRSVWIRRTLAFSPCSRTAYHGPRTKCRNTCLYLRSGRFSKWDYSRDLRLAKWGSTVKFHRKIPSRNRRWVINCPKRASAFCPFTAQSHTGSERLAKPRAGCSRSRTSRGRSEPPPSGVARLAMRFPLCRAPFQANNLISDNAARPFGPYGLPSDSHISK